MDLILILNLQVLEAVGKLIKVEKAGAQDVRSCHARSARMRFQRDEPFFGSFFLRRERKNIYFKFLTKKILPTRPSNSRTLDLMYDNNFITNELQIDDISEVTETNYSVGQIENSNNSNKLVMDSIVAATSLDKK